MKIINKEQVRLINDDCLKVLPKFPKDCVDLIFADPPYNLSNDGITCKSGKMASVNKGKWDVSRGLELDFEFHEKWISECKRILKPNGTIWISGTYHSIFMCGFALQKNGFHILNDIIWFKPNASPNMSCRYFTASHETLIWARKSKQGKHVFNYDTMKNGDFPEDFIKKPNKQMRSVWSIPTTSKKEKKIGSHPTQKPERLLERIILSSSNKGDLVLDPFMGSGTTGKIAKKLHRRFIGVELDKRFYNLSKSRIKSQE